MRPVVIAAGIVCLCAPVVWGQAVQVEVVTRQEEFLPGEDTRVGVHIVNSSGRTLNFGGNQDWLALEIESFDNRAVGVLESMPVDLKFDVRSGENVIRWFNIAPYYELNRPGRYYIRATVRIDEPRWKEAFITDPKVIGIVGGNTIWQKDFGTLSPSGGAPDTRKYALQKANLFNNRMKLYLRVTDQYESKVYRVTPIDFMTGFSKWEAKLDKYNNLHVLLQTPRAIAREFSYSMFGDDGRTIIKRTYQNSGSRPRLYNTNEGLVKVRGGARSIAKTDYPQSGEERAAAIPGSASKAPAASSKPTAPNNPLELPDTPLPRGVR